MINLRQNKGITMTVLIVMVIILFIIAGISLTQGSKMIDNMKVENYVTNMVTIKAKAKVYAEEVKSKTWDLGEEELINKREELYTGNYNMSIPDNNDKNELKQKILRDGKIIDTNKINANECEIYLITDETLELMRLDDLQKDNDYAVVYDSSDYTKLDIIYMSGIKYKNSTYYTLSGLQEAIEN